MSRQDEERRISEVILVETIRVNPGAMVTGEHARDCVRIAREFLSELETPTTRPSEQVAREADEFDS